MEYSLTVHRATLGTTPTRLNPYSNGILPDFYVWDTRTKNSCLNPYSNGILPDCTYRTNKLSWLDVLILILMEYSLTNDETKPFFKRYLS